MLVDSDVFSNDLSLDGSLVVNRVLDFIHLRFLGVGHRPEVHIDVGVIAYDLAMHRADVLDVIFAHAYQLRLHQSYNALGSGEQVSVLVCMCFGQKVLERFLIGFMIGLVLVEYNLSTRFLRKETAQQYFQSCVSIFYRLTGGIFGTSGGSRHQSGFDQRNRVHLEYSYDAHCLLSEEIEYPLSNVVIIHGLI
jgi:hypothetical protein